jgi:hypothetical protein
MRVQKGAWCALRIAAWPQKETAMPDIDLTPVLWLGFLMLGHFVGGGSDE